MQPAHIFVHVGAHFGVRFHQLGEAARIQRQQLCVRLGAGGGRVAACQNAKLAEEAARRKGLESALPPLLARHDQLDLALGDDVEAVGGVVLADDHVAGLRHHPLQTIGGLDELLLAQVGKRLRQELVIRVLGLPGERDEHRRDDHEVVEEVEVRPVEGRADDTLVAHHAGQAAHEIEGPVGVVDVIEVEMLHLVEARKDEGHIEPAVARELIKADGEPEPY